MRWILAFIFGVLGTILGAFFSALIVIFLNHTLSLTGIDYYTGLPVALVSVIILLLASGLVVGGAFGYLIGKQFKFRNIFFERD